MLENSAIQYRSPQSCAFLESTHLSLQQQQSKEISIRKRMHGLLIENFQLKERVQKLHSQLIASEEERRQLKEHLKIALNELANNDSTIDNLKRSDRQNYLAAKQTADQLTKCKQELDNRKQIISGLIEHNQNLETQINIVTEIKQKYALELNKLNLQLKPLNAINQRLTRDNQLLSQQAERLLQQICGLENELQTRRNDIEEYQKFVLQKLANAKNTEQFHESCRQQMQILQAKYTKYKQKACTYRHERDILALHLQQVSKAMDSSTLRKYYQQEDQENMPFQGASVWE